MLAAGGVGALVGTALLASPETVGPDYARDRLIAAGSADTVYTDVFDKARHQPWPARWGGRALVNSFTEEWHGRGADEQTLAGEYTATIRTSEWCTRVRRRALSVRSAPQVR